MPAHRPTQTRSAKILAALGAIDPIATRWLHLGFYRDGSDIHWSGTLLSAALTRLDAEPALLSRPSQLDVWIGRMARGLVRDGWREHRETMDRRSTRVASGMLERNSMAYDPTSQAPWEIGVRAAYAEALARLSAPARAAWCLRRIERTGQREIAFRLGLTAAEFETLFADTVRAMSWAALEYWTTFAEPGGKRMTDIDESPTAEELEAEDKLVFHYLMGDMSKAEAEALERLLEENAGMFERHAPIISFWTGERIPAELETLEEMEREDTVRRLHREPLERRAVLVTPRQPYYDWLATLGREGASELEFNTRDASRWPHVFLIPCHLDDESSDRFINERMPQLFEALLEERDRRDAWPADRSDTAFHKWFKVTYAEDVDDLVTE